MEIHERLSHQRWLTKSRNTYRHHKLITPFEFLSIFVLIHIPSNCNYIEASHGKFPLGVEAWYFCFSIASCYSKIYSLIRKRDKEKKMVLNISYLITLQEKIILATIISLLVISKIQKWSLTTVGNFFTIFLIIYYWLKYAFNPYKYSEFGFWSLVNFCLKFIPAILFVF